MERKRSELVAALQKREKSGQVGEMSRDKDVTRLANQAIAHPGRRVTGLEISRRGNLGERVARPPERFRRLLRAKLPAVPEDIRAHAAPRGKAGQPIHGSLPYRREWTPWIHLGTNRVAVVREIEMHGRSSTE